MKSLNLSVYSNNIPVFMLRISLLHNLVRNPNFIKISVWLKNAINFAIPKDKITTKYNSL